MRIRHEKITKIECMYCGSNNVTKIVKSGKITGEMFAYKCNECKEVFVG